MKTRSVIVPLSAVVLACGQAPPPPEPNAPAPQVEAYRVAVAGDSGVYRAAGSVRASQRAELATRLAGTIEGVRVRAGDRVAAGQVLLTLDAASPEAGLSQARAALDLAARTLRRMERLHADSAVPLAQLDAARAAHDQAEAQVRAARVEQGYAALRAPFAGVVTARLTDPGDLATPGRPLLVIEAAGRREIVVGVPDELAARITRGLVVPVRIGSSERRVEARVLAVVPAADAGTRTVEVRLDAGEALIPGAAAVAEFPLGPLPTILIPDRTLLRRGPLVGVLLFRSDSTVRLRWIRVGRVEGGQAEVLAGLEAADLIVLSPGALRDGARAIPRPGTREGVP
jgi:RND family efflux transporter MFP subunit